MSVPDRSIDPRLLSAAKKEFLQKGYKTASLAEICRAAGVTTGALYKRYEGKEALFSALVADTIRDMEEYTAEIGNEDLSKYTDQELFDSFCMKNDFSNREKQVFRLLITQHTNGEIAETLFITENTVKYHVRNILQKTGCKNRIELQNRYTVYLSSV